MLAWRPRGTAFRRWSLERAKASRHDENDNDTRRDSPGGSRGSQELGTFTTSKIRYDLRAEQRRKSIDSSPG